MESSADFEAGALWALELLKRQLEARRASIRDSPLRSEPGVGLVLNGVQQALDGVRADFEIAFIRNLRLAFAAREKEPR